MDSDNDQVLDSPSKNSYIGSYYQPPDRIVQIPREPELPVHSAMSTAPRRISTGISHSKVNIDSKAVVDALRTLQEKIRRLELERKQAEKSYRQFYQDAQKHQPNTASHTGPETEKSNRKELDLKLHSAESRCKVLEKQLDYMKKMVENAKKERSAQMENQKQQPNGSDNQTQQEKLEKLESEYLKLSKTQTLAEMKLAVLEQKLLKEEHERKLVQEKACELQRELDLSLRLASPASKEIKPKKKTKKATEKTTRQNELSSPSGKKHQKLPFVAGTSTSPSHSVHANVQSILHMMKHHQPQLCERVSALQRCGGGVKKNLQKEFSPSCPNKPEPGEADPSLGSLSDLLLALQDELGQMSFEHQELVRQIDANQHQEQNLDLQSEVERLEVRMEEKGAQITKLRKHQETVHKLTSEAKKPNDIRLPDPAPLQTKQKGRKRGAASQKNLQILRQTQKFRNCLKQDDISWET
ncbi:centrosomal protein CEP57L1 [Aulostomus maculatus]